MNKVLCQTQHPELNNNELNSLYVNEPGLYAIILGSNKPKGDELFDWVCRVVLPSLRRTGSYIIWQEETQADEQKPMLTIKPQKGAKYFFRDDPQMPWIQAKPVHHYLECKNISHTLERVKKGDISSLQNLLSAKGTPLNRVLRQTSHPELNNNDLNSLYVNGDLVV